MEGGLAACRIAGNSAITKKIQGWIFLVPVLRGIGGAVGLPATRCRCR